MNPFSIRFACASFLFLGAAAASLAAEKNPPGDIPDNQVFVKYASAAGGYSLKVPEGWARTGNATDVSFIDKYNGVKVAITNATEPPTPDNVLSGALADLQKSGKAVKIKSKRAVKLPGGSAVLVKYDSDSEPNAITNKTVRLENEAYVLFKSGRVAILKLWAPRGADNVDQWKLMSESFAW